MHERHPDRLYTEVRQRVEVVHGSHRDHEILMKAFAGADAVFWLMPPDPRATDVREHVLEPTRSACEAIVAHGVRRVVSVSTLGRGIEENAGQLSAARAGEHLLAQTGADFRTLRPAGFMENLLWQLDAIRNQGTLFWPHPADRTIALVATRDIAAKAAELLLDDTWTGSGEVPLVSPDALTPDDMVKILSEVLERPVRFQEISVEAYRETMLRHGASEAWARGLADMAAAQNNGVYDEEHRTARPGPTGFRQWCEEVLRPAFLA